jgi:hypothetical protein
MLGAGGTATTGNSSQRAAPPAVGGTVSGSVVNDSPTSTGGSPNNGVVNDANLAIGGTTFRPAEQPRRRSA